MQLFYVFVCSGSLSFLIAICILLCEYTIFILVIFPLITFVSLFSFVYCFIASIYVTRSIISMLTTEETKAQRS